MKKATLQVGARLRELRKSINVSQEQLALKANLTTSYIGMLERGLKSPTVDTLEKLAYALEVDIDELFRFSSKRYENSVLRRLAEKMELRSTDEKDLLYEVLVKIMQLIDFEENSK